MRFINMSVVIFLFRNVIDILILMLILRIWIFYTIQNTYNTFATFINMLSKPIVQPIKTFFPNIKNIELSSIIILVVLINIKYPILMLLNTKNIPFHNFITLIFIGFLVLCKSLGYLIFWLITIRSVFSWFNRKSNDFDYILIVLTNQIIQPIQKIILPIGNVDITPFIISLMLYCMNFVAMDLFPQLWFII
ncbi:hypothetical protein GJT86_01415 [Enterobacteriaceae endosymbiont of Macroplea appendiculata]|nr:hypothetical protein GJT86_01415 [Enterobacteriaceae endosymbiont of Macroplea appendiculata]